VNVAVIAWQVIEAVNQLRRRIDQQKLEFDEEREKLHAKMSDSFCSLYILINLCH